MAARRNRWLSLLQNSYIAKGFAQDCEELIERCKKIGGALSYKVFCEIWIDMNFASMYNKRSSGPEIAELSEECVHIAKTFMTANTSNFEGSVAALFLVYALINLQPYERFAALRLTPDDVESVHRLEMVARRERRFDVLYILGSVMIKGPSEYHAEERERGCDRTVLKYLHGYGDVEANAAPRGVFYRQNTELDLLKDINSLSKQYTKAKKRVMGGQKPDPSLSYTEENFASQLESTLSKLVRGLEVDKKQEEEPDHYDKVQAIKRRAMMNKGKAVKHLSTICDNLPDNETLNKKKADIGENSGKIKSNNPKKPVITGTPRKQLSVRKTKKYRNKRRKKIEILDDSTSEDEYMSLHSDDEYSDEANDLNLDNFTQGNLDEQIEAEERELNEAVDRMPLRRTTRKLFEIEIEGSPINASKNPKIEPQSKTDDVDSNKRTLRLPKKTVPNVSKAEKKSTDKKKELITKGNSKQPEKPEKSPKSIIDKAKKQDVKEIASTQTNKNEPEKRARRRSEDSSITKYNLPESKTTLKSAKGKATKQDVKETSCPKTPEKRATRKSVDSSVVATDNLTQPGTLETTPKPTMTKNESTNDEIMESLSKSSENEPKTRVTRSIECESEDIKSPDGSASRKRKPVKESPEVKTPSKLRKKN